MKSPQKNIGTVDRIIRALLGVAALVLALLVDDVLIRIACIAVGVFSIYQAVASWCFFYMLIGKNTCPVE